MFWDGSHWVAETTDTPVTRPSRLTDWAVTGLMIFAIGAVALPLQLVAASSHNTGSAASCTLSSVVLGGAAVIEIDAVGVRHSTDFMIEWAEPAITQTEYMWSTSQGTLMDTVMNDQGSGTYSAALYWRSNKGDVWEASCSTTV